ncbi:MAG: hypothetical protein K9W42_06575 [Candidatus Heimdallarchaeota archaeon]|nr:hypothetical protein [Candidatus Heimdallarchaeota archaeon]
MTKSFLIYSFDSSTVSYDLNGQEVNLCLILGRANGSTPIEAVTDFFNNNPWIREFEFENIAAIEINESNHFYTSISQNPAISRVIETED